MPISTEIIVNGTLVPSVSGQPTHSEQYCEGGYRTVATTSLRDEIQSTDQLKAGMVVHVISPAATYMWNGASWEENGFIADESIEAVKLAPDSVTSTKILNGEIGTLKLADASVVSSKLADGTAITFTDILIYSIASPTTSGAIQLTGEIGGSKNALVLLEVHNVGGSAYSASFAEEVSALGNQVDGVGHLTLTAGTRGYVIVKTDAVSRFWWVTSVASTTEVKLKAFMR